jgi:hypothetical protein
MVLAHCAAQIIFDEYVGGFDVRNWRRCEVGHEDGNNDSGDGDDGERGGPCGEAPWEGAERREGR